MWTPTGWAWAAAMAIRPRGKTYLTIITQDRRAFGVHQRRGWSWPPTLATTIIARPGIATGRIATGRVRTRSAWATGIGIRRARIWPPTLRIRIEARHSHRPDECRTARAGFATHGAFAALGAAVTRPFTAWRAT